MKESRQVQRAKMRALKKMRESLAKAKTVRPNPIRQMLLDKVRIALLAHNQREEIGDQKFLHQAMDFNAEYIERSRGHGRHTPFIKSVALAVDNTMVNPSKQH